MAAAAEDSKKSSDVEERLKPFYERAAQAEERLSRLEAVFAGKKDSGVEEMPSFVKEFQLKLNTADAEEISKLMASKEIEALAERNTKLAAGNLKLQTGIVDLVEGNANLAASHAKKAEETMKLAAEMGKLAAENAKLQYRVAHLVKALKEADHKLESK
ncbi:uncharacterized protein LOC131250888 isoform X2 [Magnolia sinica]|uniref:uncharacterized protein LOC131250888 isoform X2 n=1 Tax=Magnolia sinica TaxID=86752 RepID=UPI002659E188|nr:uncharacterized protein LOC131250888 isoform X2 [Magnolia sinica]